MYVCMRVDVRTHVYTYVHVCRCIYLCKCISVVLYSFIYVALHGIRCLGSEQTLKGYMVWEAGGPVGIGKIAVFIE